MYQGIVFFDLDGTLLNDEKQVPQENLAALAQLQKNNILPALSTGRNLFELKDLLAATHIDTVNGANGAYVMYHNEKLSAAPISPKTIEALNEKARSEDLQIAYYNDQHFAVTGKNQLVEDNYHMLRFNQVPVDPDFYKQEPVYMMLLFTPHQPKLDRQIEYEDEFADQLHFFRNGPYALDVVRNGIDKGVGIKTLLKDAKLEGVPTYAFGDGYNDLEMFQAVDHPISMANGVTQAQEMADFVTTTNLDGGIVKGLQHFDLI
ncbi:HAD superfamily hydrolase [Lactobacillus selangorensis]|uniref:HAD superfamily hydrolase n=1 Tax=Lactobacillus selangorensis TaxID=81857 RepID=A0A0R2FMR5_9LACO|nr:Cof-type HAD-IIB family hydrolase [Lactobacillus selangorensis]KRN28987.1 HAD superfamily hydrolase [Lactobacillus selangorensis]KRN32603.1 HAD superfamily hydrolase [Lactobacillus selangorensis]